VTFHCPHVACTALLCPSLALAVLCIEAMAHAMTTWFFLLLARVLPGLAVRHDIMDTIQPSLLANIIGSFKQLASWH
jgi:hypothetical protein